MGHTLRKRKTQNIIRQALDISAQGKEELGDWETLGKERIQKNYKTSPHMERSYGKI